MNHNRPIILLLLLLLLLLHLWTATAQQSPTSPTNNSNINPYSNSNFNESIVIVLVLIGSSFFIVIFYTIIRQFAGDRNGDAVNRGTGGVRSQRINRGIEASVLEAFPTFLYSDVKGLKLGNDTLVCAICINEFEDDKTLRLLPKCDHVFHTECIDTWLATHTTCPVCRSNLVPDPNSSDPPRIIPPAAVEESVDHVAVRIEEEVVDPTPSSSLLLPLKRNWSGSTRRFPRSHSTGHSVVAPGENCERFTLRLPEHVRREILVGGRFHQSKSLLSSPTEESSRRGCRSGGGGGREGSNRGGRGGLKSLRLGSLMSRSRSVSFLSPRMMTAAATEGGGEGSVKGEGGSQRGVFNAPFNCRCGGGADDEWLMARLNPPV